MYIWVQGLTDRREISQDFRLCNPILKYLCIVQGTFDLIVVMK